MPLMERLKGDFFLDLTPPEQLEKIRSLQLLRTNEIKLARTVRKTKPRKTTTKKASAKPKKTKQEISAAKALKALEKLSAGQLENLENLLGE